MRISRKDMKKELPKIDMFKNYVGQLIFRICVFLFLLWAYFFRHEYFELIITKSDELKWQAMGFSVEEMKEMLFSQASIWWVWVVWALFMLHMIFQMIPESKYITMGSRKNFAKHFHPVEDYDKLEMYQYVQKNNLGAVWTLLVWLGFNGIFGALYVFGIIGIPELILLTGAYFVCDLICVVIWCPFQRFLIKNRCCVNCRIFNWGYFMIFTPCLFIRNFFTWSLFFTSVVLLIRWEITLLRYPERFWEGSNSILQCENCQDKICKQKGMKLFDEQGHIIKLKKAKEN